MPRYTTPIDWDLRRRLGRNIRRWRESYEWTIATVAEKADLSDGMVSDIENGKTGWSIETIDKLARAHETDIGSLLTRDPATARAADQKRISDMISRWRNLRQEDQRRVEEFADALQLVKHDGA